MWKTIKDFIARIYECLSSCNEKMDAHGTIFQGKTFIFLISSFVYGMSAKGVANFAYLTRDFEDAPWNDHPSIRTTGEKNEGEGEGVRGEDDDG